MSKKSNNQLPDVWVNEIPTAPSSFKANVVSIAVFMLGLMGLFVWFYGPAAIENYFSGRMTSSFISNVETVVKNPVTNLKAAKDETLIQIGVKKEESAENKSDGENSEKNGSEISKGPSTDIDELEAKNAAKAEESEEEEVDPNATRNYLKESIPFKLLRFTPIIAGLIGLICIASGIASFIRTRYTLFLVRLGLAWVYPAVIAYTVLVWIVLHALVENKLPLDGRLQDKVTIIKIWWYMVWPALAMVLYVFWLHVMMKSRSVYAAFTSRSGEIMSGDRVLEDLRTHGHDPRARRSFYLSAFTHFMIFIGIPFLMGLGGCVEPYRPPKGSGDNAVPVAVVKVKKKKKKKQLKLRPDSAIIIDIPPLDDTEVDKQMEVLTDVQYENMMKNAKSGSPGKGGKGGPPGWPEGEEGAEIRFIRLNHGGVGWDDGMKKTLADKNFMREFQRVTRFKNVRKTGEAHPISHLALYPKDGFPPFVYMTGNGRMGRVSNNDIKILHEYCMRGGMLVGDAGSGSFDRDFRNLMSKVFPNKRLIDIADDDRIYQLPFNFPNGAPEFWHHGGRRAMGIKHNNRWIVFYHPGDMNDAWKSSSYSKVTPEMRRNAYNLGINIIFYAFNEWNDAVKKLRK